MLIHLHRRPIEVPWVLPNKSYTQRPQMIDSWLLFPSRVKLAIRLVPPECSDYLFSIEYGGGVRNFYRLPYVKFEGRRCSYERCGYL